MNRNGRDRISHSDRIEEAVANDVIKNYKGGKAHLTNTNYEALQIQGYLPRRV